MGQCRGQGDGAAGFWWGDLGPSHSHSLGLRISIYAFDPKNSSRLRILGPLSTSNPRYDPKLEEDCLALDVFPRLDLVLALAQIVLGLSPCHQGDMLQAFATRE